MSLRIPDIFAADPIMAAILAYRAATDAFNALPDAESEADTDAQIERTYGPPAAVLMDWSQPAQSHQGAVEALRLAVEENRIYSGSDIADSMVKAALGFFDQAR